MVSSADLDNLIKATGTGLTISGFQVRAGSTMIEESDKPYSMTFPRLYIGFGLLDKITFVKTDNANN